MEKIDNGISLFTEVFSMDEKGSGGANHKYIVQSKRISDDPIGQTFARIDFQHGGVAETGPNGCHNEDLLAIVIHRLQCFQASSFACQENAFALENLEEAMQWLNHRTVARQARGVEGKSVV